MSWSSITSVPSIHHRNTPFAWPIVFSCNTNSMRCHAPMLKTGAAVISVRLLTPATALCCSIETGKLDRKSTRLNSSHLVISYAVFCLKKKKKIYTRTMLVKRRLVKVVTTDTAQKAKVYRVRNPHSYEADTCHTHCQLGDTVDITVNCT